MDRVGGWGGGGELFSVELSYLLRSKRGGVYLFRVNLDMLNFSPF